LVVVNDCGPSTNEGEIFAYSILKPLFFFPGHFFSSHPFLCLRRLSPQGSLFSLQVREHRSLRFSLLQTFLFFDTGSFAFSQEADEAAENVDKWTCSLTSLPLICLPQVPLTVFFPPDRSLGRIFKE